MTLAEEQEYNSFWEELGVKTAEMQDKFNKLSFQTQQRINSDANKILTSGGIAAFVQYARSFQNR